MVTIEISEQLAEKLNKLVSQTQQSVESILEQALKEYVETLQETSGNTKDEWVYDESKDLALLILKAAEELNLRSGRSDTSQLTSEEIAEQYTQYLMDSLDKNL